MFRIVRRVVLASVIISLVGAFAAAVAAAILLTGSFARESGQAAVPGLAAPVEVRRDAMGVPVIRADTFEDAAAAMGFVHAQDRFFQMDLLRRSAAGELSALLGRAALDADKRSRRFRFRAVSRELLPRLPEHHRLVLEAYARGVNAGMADLTVRPPEYLVLRAAPEPWTAEDSLLAMFSMFDALAMGARFERCATVMHETLGPDLASFLLPETTRFDSPLVSDRSPFPSPAPIPAPPAPPEETEPPDGRPVPVPVPEPDLPGSNNWAIAGARTTDGRAILSNDMHLPHSVPNIWHRVQVELPGVRLVGVTLPGFPMIVAGSNGSVAWGFTNTTGDFADLIRIRPDPADGSLYLTPEGPDAFVEHDEPIRVRGGPDEPFTVRETRWGPVIDDNLLSAPVALRWIALDAQRVNINLLDLIGAQNLDQATAVLRSWHGPPQNVAVADAHGRVGLTVSGWLPRRQGHTGLVALPSTDPNAAWDSRLEDNRRPSVLDPADGVIFSANNRVFSLDEARMLGRHWALGERAGRIAGLLRAIPVASERAMLDVALDTRAGLFEPYRAAALALAEHAPDDPRLSSAIDAVRSWNGRADADQPGFTVLVRFRAGLWRMLVDPHLQACRDADPAFRYFWFQSDEPLLRLIAERPPEWLPDDFASWPDALARVLSESVEPDGDSPEWGQRNRAAISHPLARAVPQLAQVLNMPRDPLPGHASTVRVQTPSFGASQRLVVSPGREEDAIFHMPAGQSGHPLSRHYRAGHHDWVKGEPTPLLAGEPQTSFRLLPAP